MELLIGTVESGADGGLMAVDFSEGIGVGTGFQERLAKIGGGARRQRGAQHIGRAMLRRVIWLPRLLCSGGSVTPLCAARLAWPAQQSSPLEFSVAPASAAAAAMSSESVRLPGVGRFAAPPPPASIGAPAIIKRQIILAGHTGDADNARRRVVDQFLKMLKHAAFHLDHPAQAPGAGNELAEQEALQAVFGRKLFVKLRLKQIKISPALAR